MRIGIIQASSQKDKNRLIEESVKLAVQDKGYEVVNFGIFPEDDANYSYVQIALCVSLLLSSGAVDYIVTGCSSGQGMMLACNSFPGVECGYIANVSDAYLFGRINNGNAVSYPLGLNFGWAAEVNLKNTMTALFEEPMGAGYPRKDAARKQRDTVLLKEVNFLCKKPLTEVLALLDRDYVQSCLHYQVVYEYILKHGSNKELLTLIGELS